MAQEMIITQKLRDEVMTATKLKIHNQNVLLQKGCILSI